MTAAELDISHLRPITRRPSLGTYLRELAARHEYLREVPKSDLHAQKLNTLLGNLWFLLNPILQTGVYLLVFGVLLNVDRGIDNYPVYLVAGIMIFRFFSQGLGRGANSVLRNQTLMRSLYFPRAIVPLATTLGTFYMFLPGALVIMIIAAATGETPTWRWLLVPAVLVITFTFVAGCAMFTARLGHVFPDLDQVLPHITRLGFYASGTIYNPSSFTDDDVVLALFDLNPVYQLLSLMRWAVMDQSMPGWFWLTAPAYALAALTTGFLFFWRAELTYGSPR